MKTVLRFTSAISLSIFVLTLGIFAYRQSLAAPGVAQAGETESPWSAEGLSDFEWTERDGSKVTNETLKGQPFVVGFVFTTCQGPCPKVTLAMKQLQDRFKDEPIRLVTMTVWPEKDTTEVLTKYADAFGADKEKWLFVTGETEKLYNFIQNDFVMPVKKATGPSVIPGFEIVHTTNLLLVDANGVVQGKYNALNDTEQAKLRKAIREELKQAKADD